MASPSARSLRGRLNLRALLPSATAFGPGRTTPGSTTVRGACLDITHHPGRGSPLPRHPQYHFHSLRGKAPATVRPVRDAFQVAEARGLVRGWSRWRDLERGAG